MCGPSHSSVHFPLKYIEKKLTNKFNKCKIAYKQNIHFHKRWIANWQQQNEQFPLCSHDEQFINTRIRLNIFPCNAQHMNENIFHKKTAYISIYWWNFNEMFTVHLWKTPESIEKSTFNILDCSWHRNNLLMNKQFYKTNLNDNKIKGCKKGNRQQAPIVNKKKTTKRKGIYGKKLVELELKWWNKQQ